MANIIDDICPEGSILDGFDDWPRSATRKEWFRALEPNKGVSALQS